MQEISNSLRQRLRARPEPKVHPDPDLLTAYIEQSLPSAERSQIVQHLAECSYCREVVALSLPEPQPEQVVAQPAGRSRWWVPAYRWAAAMATIAIAATLVIEKPWKTRSSTFERPAASENSQAASSPGPAASPVAPTPAGNSLEATQPATVGSKSDLQSKTPAALTTSAAQKTTQPPVPVVSARSPAPESAPTPRDDRNLSAGQPSGSAGGTRGVIGGVSETAVAGLQAAPPPSRPVAAAHAQPSSTAETAYNYAQQDYVNRGLLSNQVAEAKLPEAPAPKEERAASEDAARQRKSAAPRLSTDSLVASSMNLPVEPPNTATDQAAPSAAGTTLDKSSGFMPKLKSTLGPAVRHVINTAKKTNAAKAPEPAGGLSLTGSAPIYRVTDADKDGKRAAEGIHWSITPDGRLLRSTDVSGQWHEINPQGADIRFRVVEPHDGPEVWVGGNHGTLIHSWNAGVDWSKLNVPDSGSSDITAISIDGDNVQVKTSNGETFVSNDHGKTWIPLQQQPQ